VAFKASVPRVIRSSPYWPVVQHPVMRRLLPGFAVSYVGDGMSAIAVSWLAIQLVPAENRGIWVAIAVAAYTFPGVLGTVLFARFMSGRSGAQLAGWDAVLRGSALALIPVAYAFGVLTIWLYIALLAISSLLHTWGSAGRFTLITELLPQRDHLPGNAILGMLAEIATVVGPVIAAVLIGWSGAALVIAVDAATFALLAATYLIWVPKTRRTAPAERKASSIAGFSAIWHDRQLLALVTLTFGFFFLYGPVQVALPIHAAAERGGSASTLVAYWTAFGIGAVLGGFVAGYLRRWSLWLTTVGIVVGWGIALLPLGLGAPSAIALIAFALGGFIWAPFFSTSMALLQRSTSDVARPQVIAANSALVTLSVPLGILVGGPVVQALGPLGAVTASAVLTIILGVAAGAFTLLRPGRFRQPARDVDTNSGQSDDGLAQEEEPQTSRV
jgi:DHA3 family macrolide efflux protein-like MFS transporter